jgi:uncharacterized protein
LAQSTIDPAQTDQIMRDKALRLCFIHSAGRRDSGRACIPGHLGECRMEQSLIASPATLNARHAELDVRLAREEGRPAPDAVIIAQLKKAKLQIKDALARV